MNKSESIKELASALSLFQHEVKNALKTSVNPFFKANYANLEEIIETSREPLKRHNLSVCQFPYNDADHIGIETMLMHGSGEFISTKISVKNLKGDIQSAGSILSYLRRYSLAAVLKIAQADNDGSSAMPYKKPNHDESLLSKTVFKGGEYDGKKFCDVNLDDLINYYDSLEDYYKKEKKPKSELFKALGNYLNDLGV